MAISRDLRADRAGGRWGQRDRPDLRRDRTGAVDPVRLARRARSRRPTRARRRDSYRRADAADFAVVDLRSAHAGRVRPRRVEVQRDRPGRRAHVDTERGFARPRLLVLLRPGPARVVDRVRARLHPAPVRAPCGLRPRRALPPRRRVHALAPPRVLRAAALRRSRHRGRRASVREPYASRRIVQVVRERVDRGPGASQHRAGGPTGRARARRVPRTRHEHGVRLVARAPEGGVRIRRARARRCADLRELPGTRRRDFLRQEPAARREAAVVLDAGDRRARRRRPPNPHSGRARRRLRLVHVGQHRRSDHTRPHRPAVCRARAHPLRDAGHRRSPERDRSPAAGGHCRSGRSGRVVAADGRRRRRRAQRHPVRAVRPRAAGESRGGARGHAGTRSADRLRNALEVLVAGRLQRRDQPHDAVDRAGRRAGRGLPGHRSDEDRARRVGRPRADGERRR